MRIPLFVLFLLQALAALSQPAIGPEVSSNPLSQVFVAGSVAAPSVAMARDRTGVAIAWVMPNPLRATRIYVARLDATAHIEGEVREIPVTSTAGRTDAFYPSLAASVTGNGFTLAWTEFISDPVLPTSQAAFCQLDGTLRPSRPVALVEPSSADVPAIVRSGKAKTWITAKGLVWEMSPDGALQGPLNAGVVAGDMTVATDFPQLVGSRRVVADFTCNPDPNYCYIGNHSWGCPDQCKIYRYSTNLTFTALYKTSAGVPFSYDTFAQPALQTDGHDVLMAWYDGAQTTGGTVQAARIDPGSFDFSSAVKASQSLGMFTPDAGQTRPDVATDGQRYVVVWRTRSPSGDHDIVGASLDGSGHVTSFSVAASSADELDPSIVALGNGVFLVAYETFSDGVRRIAGRSLTFGTHRHAVLR